MLTFIAYFIASAACIFLTSHFCYDSGHKHSALCGALKTSEYEILALHSREMVTPTRR